MPRALGYGLLSLVIAVASLASSPPAGAEHAAPVLFELDTHSLSVPAEAVGPVLAAGQQYRLTVEGTFSVWSASAWDRGTCKGVTEPASMFSSPGVENGPVALDAEFLFAAPTRSSVCRSNAVLPRHGQAFGVSLDGGASFEAVTPESLGDQPDPDHRYGYRVSGQGLVLVMRLNDTASSDNYGTLLVTVEPLVHDAHGDGHEHCYVVNAGARDMLAQLPAGEHSPVEGLGTALSALESCGTGSTEPADGGSAQEQVAPRPRPPAEPSQRLRHQTHGHE